jgi:hypothetical protein
VDEALGPVRLRRKAVIDHTSAYVSIRQHTSGLGGKLLSTIRQHTSAYVSIRQHTSGLGGKLLSTIRPHTSAYVSIRQHTSGLGGKLLSIPMSVLLRLY